MRLMIIAPHFPEYSWRYAEAMSQHAEVLVCLDEHQFKSEFVGRNWSRHAPARLVLMRFKTPLDLFKLIIRTVKYQPSAIHFQEAVGPRRRLFSAVILTLFKPFVRVVLTVHDPVPHAGRDQFVAQRSAWTRDYLRHRSDIVVVHGQHCLVTYLKWSIKSEQRVIVSTHGLILEPPQLLPARLGRLKLIFFGRMELYKGLDVLLSTVELLHGTGLDYKLLITGCGPELDRLQARFEVFPEVTVLNAFALPTDIMRSIQEADCVLLPYLSATQSGVLAAAYAGRRYVIASDIGGLRDIVVDGRNGILVPPGDAQALASAVLALATDIGLRAKLLEGAKETAEGQLDWSHIVEDLYKVLAV